MRGEAREVRTFQAIENDGLYPKEFPRPNEPFCDRRCRTITEVLERLPEIPYRRLTKIKNSKRHSLDWFVPKLDVQGLVFPFIPNVRPRKVSFRLERHGETILRPFARIIYLSLLLEFFGKGHLVYVVAHELAHLDLNHATHFTDTEGAKSEQEVSCRVRSWGFEIEADRIEGLNKATESELAGSRECQAAGTGEAIRPAGTSSGLGSRSGLSRT
jgi:hypothetical protein